MRLNLDKNHKYLLACSYGPDSMALFHMLKSEGYEFEAAIVNYRLREESDQEMEDFISYCKAQNIVYHKLVVGGFEKKNNLEAKCRTIRYKFFAELKEDYIFDEVLVAHNQDDLIETYLLQKKRKNQLFFYGIKESTVINRVRIRRPLLSISKADLLKYCEENNVPFAIDKTNLENDFERNKIRHEIVEKMSKEEREETIKQIQYRNFLIETKLDYLSKLDLEDAEQLETLDIEEFIYAINLLVKRVDEAASISKKQCLEILKAIESDKSNVEIKLTRGLIFEKSYGRVSIYKDKKCDYSYRIDSPIELDTEYFYLNFLGDSSNRNVTPSDYPLTIRNAKANDTYVIKDYRVKVNRLFIDWKMPPHLRKRWPVILNKENKIIYIPRYQKSFVVLNNTNFYVK